MDELIDFMLEYGHFNSQQIALIKSKLQETTVPKGKYFSEAGKVAQRVGFISRGLMRVCYYNKDGEEFTRCFMGEKRFVADMNSFYNETACSEYVEALTDCKLLILSKEVFTELAATIMNWNEIFIKITSKAMMKKLNASSAMLVQDATTRYRNFLEHNPGLANHIPLSMLASYLGITQSSLSRIRKSIS